jgi:lysozyme family protein
MKNNFEDVVAKIRKDEGDAYTNDPADSGGPTKFGITLKDVQLHLNKNATAEDVKALTWDKAKWIYKTKYWDSLDADNLPSGLDYTVVDYGVNSGLGRPRKALQQFKSLQGVELIDAINNERMGFLKALAARRPKDQKFLKGWTNRVERVRAYSKVLAKGGSSVPTGSGTAAVAVGGGGFIYTYWHLFQQHWITYTAGLILTAVLIDIAIHLYNRKK